MYRRAVLRGERADDPEVARVVVAVGREYRRSGIILGIGLLVVSAVALALLSIPLEPLGFVAFVLLVTLGVYVVMWFRFGRAISANAGASSDTR